MDQETKGTKFSYESDSLGPPPPITDFILKAIELTDPWFYQQQKAVDKQKKKWWQLWK